MINKTKQLRIKNKLLKLNMKQVDLANELGVHKQQLNNVINGKVENLKLEEKILERLEIR